MSISQLNEYRKATLDMSGRYISWNGHKIMDRNEKDEIQYAVKLLCEKLRPLSVLEVGFGFGLTAEVFGTFVKRHRIVEIHPQICELGKKAGYDMVLSPIHEYEDLNEYDLIYDDIYPFPFLPVETYERFNKKNLAHLHMGGVAIMKGYPFRYNEKPFFQPLEAR